MQRQFLRGFGPEVEVRPEPPKPQQPEDRYEGPAQTPRGRLLCFRCGRLLYRNNKSHICTVCQRKFGLPTLRRRNKPLQQWHLSICQDKNCKDPAHWAAVLPSGRKDLSVHRSRKCYQTAHWHPFSIPSFWTGEPPNVSRTGLTVCQQNAGAGSGKPT